MLSSASWNITNGVNGEIDAEIKHQLAKCEWMAWHSSDMGPKLTHSSSEPRDLGIIAVLDNI